VQFPKHHGGDAHPKIQNSTLIGTNGDLKNLAQYSLSTTTNPTPSALPIGLDQGCPLFPIAFLFYSANLTRLGGNRQDLLILGFVDGDEASQKLT